MSMRARPTAVLQPLKTVTMRAPNRMRAAANFVMPTMRWEILRLA
jgi:hypothetical protein